MREIKFRCYSEQDKIMYQPLALEVIAQLGHNFSDNIKIMQYTGLKDKNGVEIYEGDIVIEKSYPFFGNAPEIIDSNQKCDELNYVGVIIWEDGYYVDLKVVSNRVIGSAMGQSLYDYEELEVVGNIYQNKELLK